MFRRHYMTTVEVTCKDKSYEWLLAWITQRGARKTQHLSVDTTFVETEAGKVSTKYDFQPSVGTHIMRHNVSMNVFLMPKMVFDGKSRKLIFRVSGSVSSGPARIGCWNRGKLSK